MRCDAFTILAQEPTTTVLRVAVLEGDKDVAYETCRLSSLRPGYRVLHLRSLLGTRIEACVLFVRISHGVEPNRFMRSSRSLKDSELVQARIATSSRQLFSTTVVASTVVGSCSVVASKHQPADE
jgi:hypothetical protein